MSFHNNVNATEPHAQYTPAAMARGPMQMKAGEGAVDLSLVYGIGARSLGQIFWRRVLRQREVLVLFEELPETVNRIQRLMLSLADGVIVAPEMVGAVCQMGVASNRVVASGRPFDHSVFMACPVGREAADAYRIVYAGELSPQSGVADFLSCAIGWAERAPDKTLEIVWLGTGDLEGVLQAQLVPPNLQQVFQEMPSKPERAAIFAHCGAMVVPNLSDYRLPFITEAMAAGLVVLGSMRSAQVRSLVVGSGTGWTFDPLSPDTITAALDGLFDATTDGLDEMRMAARAKINTLQTERIDDAISRSLQSRLSQMMASHSPIEA